jgi:hypothetical protein
VIYGLFASAATTLAMVADPKHLTARRHHRGTPYLGSALTHHPHVHMIVPGGGLSEDASKWVSSRPRFLVYVTMPPRAAY